MALYNIFLPQKFNYKMNALNKLFSDDSMLALKRRKAL